jgi:hypothetical protein
VLQSIDYKGISFKYDNYKTDKLRFVPEPKRLPKTKTIVLPLLEFNPQYNTINSTIADANLALQIKDNYENVNYVPITSSGYRGFSALNSRRNGIKLGFNEGKRSTQTSIVTQENEYKPQTPLKLEPKRRNSEPSIKTGQQEFFSAMKSTPSPSKMEIAPEIPYSAPSSGELYVPPGKKKGKRLFDTLIKDANKAKTRSESFPGSGQKYRNNRQSAALPGRVRDNSNPFLVSQKSDEEN